MKDIHAIVQARMGSNRLPGKVLMKLGKKIVLEHIIDNLKSQKIIDKIIIATTTKNEDDAVYDFCRKININVFRGNENDVLDRYYNAAEEYNSKNIIRFTADNIFLNSELLATSLQKYFELNFNEIENGYLCTSDYPVGLNIEIFSFMTLGLTNKLAISDSDREHVTKFIYTNPDLFNINYLKSPKDYKNMRLTLDTNEDFKYLDELLPKIGNKTLIESTGEIENIIQKTKL